MPLKTIDVKAMQKIGTGLERPEDVVVSKSGRIFASDHQCSCAEILPNGSLNRIGPKGGAPNGINMDENENIIIANFGIYDGEAGPLQKLNTKTGELINLVEKVENIALTSSNYPIIAKDGTIYCTHSTSAEAWPLALDGREDGFIFRITPNGTTDIIAKKLKFANGCCLDENETHLYVNQTSGGNVLRFPIRQDGTLGSAEEYGPMLGIIPDFADPDNLPNPEDRADWAFTDGNGFDQEGNLWVTLPSANKLVAITPAREVFTVAHDPSGEMLNTPTNVSWGGSDLCDLYVGSISSNYVVHMRSPIPGMPLIHQR